jgi:hypothetical protein
MGRGLALMSVGALAVLAATPGGAQTASPAPPPPPYSAPWLLRSATVANAVRVDETVAFYEDPVSGNSGTTAVTSFSASRKFSPHWGGLARMSWVHNDAATGPSGSALSNLVLGATYLHPSGPWRVTGFTAFALPVGTGSGDDPDPGDAAAVASAAPARSAMDNTLWAVNYWGFFVGGGAARVTRGLTAQLEGTVMHTRRTRGPETQDESRTNLTMGLHLGHFFSPRVSLGGEIRMQRWLSDAAPVRANEAARDQFTFGIGPRLHFKVGAKSWIRPGLSYTRALDDPMSDRGYDIVQLDTPISF